MSTSAPQNGNIKDRYPPLRPSVEPAMRPELGEHPVRCSPRQTVSPKLAPQSEAFDIVPLEPASAAMTVTDLTLKAAAPLERFLAQLTSATPCRPDLAASLSKFSELSEQIGSTPTQH